MKKNTLLLVGLGAVALFLFMRRGTAQGRRRGEVFVESPEPISESEFGIPEETEQPRNLVDTIQNIAQKGGEVFNNIRDGVQQRRANDMIYLPGSNVPTGLTRSQLAKMQRKKKLEEQRKKRQQARTTRKTTRQQARATRKAQRKVRRRKVGEIGVLF